MHPKPPRLKLGLLFALLIGLSGIAQAADVLSTGFCKAEFFTGITGGTVADLTSSDKFLNNLPDDTRFLPAIDSPNGYGDSYGARLSGFIVPDETTDYDFFISSDDGSKLFLSADQNPPDPLNDEPICQETTCCRGFTEPPSPLATATPISLVAGQKYAFVALLKEGGGGDFLRVAMRKVGDPTPAASLKPISGRNLAVLTPANGAVITFSTQPSSQSIVEGRSALLTASATANATPAGNLLVSYQWQKDGQDIPGATSASYRTPLLAFSDSGAKYSVTVYTIGAQAKSADAVLTVTHDTTAPVVDQVILGSGPTLLVTLKYNEALDEASAVQAANYNFGAGVSVVNASISPLLFDSADQHPYQTVTLSVTGLAQNVPYSLAVQGVKDFFGNVIVPATFSGTTPLFEINWAMSGTATQSSTAVGGEPEHAIDGNTDGFFANHSVTLNAAKEDPGWWEVDLGSTKPIGRLKVWFRTLDAGECSALFNFCATRNDDFTLSILDQNHLTVWTRTYPGRPPLQVAYNLPPGVTGQYVRFESQTPLTTSDGFFSLAEVQVIAPYQNVGLSITTDLAPTATVTENRQLVLGPIVAALSGGAGAPSDVLSYQWQENGIDIPGANRADYQTPVLALGQTGIRYRCQVLISGQKVASTETVVTVEKDTAAPTIKGVIPGNSNTDLTVVFSEAVTEDSASNPANYALSGGLQITEIVILSPSAVRLTTSTQTPGTTYTLTVNGIRDLASGGGNLIGAGTTFNFTVPQSDASKYLVIGDPGNPKDTQWNTARGTVGYVYEISKFKVTNADYAAFLNAKAKSDPYNLMVSGGGEIIREGEPGSYTYRALEGRENRPVLFVAAVDAMRMANWLSNGGTEDSDTETGSYTFSGNDVVSKRNANADYVLPNDDEWYKAAYYDPTKNGTGGYWQFPPKTDNPDQMVAEAPPGGPFSANFNNATAGNGNGTTDVGAYTSASSHYGTFDQAGLTWEWNEPADPTTKSCSRRGGSQANAIARLAAGVVAGNPINKSGATVNQGFRLARAHRVRFPWVTVSNPGNPKDTQWNTARGQVNYTYKISKFKVTNADYAAFLNAKAKSDPNNLMVSGGGEIIREGEAGSYTYRVLDGRENRPVLFVAAVDAMRMANWLSNGGTENSDTETGSYTFSGNDVVSKRNPNADYVLPNDDEWYKAAYYDPTKKGTGGYWQFPPKTDNPDQMVAEAPPGGPFSANFNNATPGGNGTTDVGAYTSASSYYGTFDQAGLTWEWNEPVDPTTKSCSRRGGSQANAIARLAAGVIAGNPINKSGATVNQGFRLALVPSSPPAPVLTITHPAPTTVQISWTGTGTLESATTPTGAWTPVANSTNPYFANPSDAARYFRVVQP